MNATQAEVLRVMDENNIGAVLVYIEAEGRAKYIFSHAIRSSEQVGEIVWNHLAKKYTMKG